MSENYAQAARRLSRRMDERRIERRKHIIKVTRAWRKNFIKTHPDVFLFPLTAGGRKYLREYLSGEMDDYTMECIRPSYKMDFDDLYQEDEDTRAGCAECHGREYLPEFPEDSHIMEQLLSERYEQ